MKRFFTFMVVALMSVTLTSCEIDKLWNEIDLLKDQVQANSEEIATLSSLIDALNNGKVIVGTEQTATGYKLLFSDGFSTPASDKTLYKIVATGYDANEQATGTAEFVLCNGKNNIVSEWTKFDLSGLGKVVKITFNLVGSDDLIGDYGLNCPAYFAYDDVAVRF